MSDDGGVVRRSVIVLLPPPTPPLLPFRDIHHSMRWKGQARPMSVFAKWRSDTDAS